MFNGQKYKIENMRRFKRLNATYLVKFQVAGAQGEPFVANIKDLSAGGCKFWSDHYLADGVLLKLSLWIPPIGKTLDALARTVRVRRAASSDLYYVAVRFLEVSKEVQLALNDFIEDLSKSKGGRSLVSDEPVVTRKAVLA